MQPYSQSDAVSSVYQPLFCLFDLTSVLLTVVTFASKSELTIRFAIASSIFTVICKRRSMDCRADDQYRISFDAISQVLAVKVLAEPACHSQVPDIDELRKWHKQRKILASQRRGRLKGTAALAGKEKKELHMNKKG